MSNTYFGDRKIGETFRIDAGAGCWIKGVKLSVDTFKKENGVVIGVSRWTKTK